MTLPSSGAMSFTQIQSEFSNRGTSNNFSDYYRGGPYVTSWSGTANIPTSAAGMSMTQFYGATQYPGGLAGSVSPSSLSATGNANNGPVTTANPATCSASGGSGSYSYTWSWSSGGTGLVINSPNSSSTTFTTNGIGTFTGVAICTISDGVTSVQASGSCSVSITGKNIGG